MELIFKNKSDTKQYKISSDIIINAISILLLHLNRYPLSFIHLLSISFLYTHLYNLLFIFLFIFKQKEN